MQQALIYLAAGFIGVPLFKRLGLGSVLGFLVAGVAIGPWALGLISDPRTVLRFSELGVALLLFLIELNVQRVWALRHSIFGLGGVQVAVTVGAVTALATLVGSRSSWVSSWGWASPCRRPPSGSPRWRKRTCSPPQIDEQHDAR